MLQFFYKCLFFAFLLCVGISLQAQRVRVSDKPNTKIGNNTSTTTTESTPTNNNPSETTDSIPLPDYPIKDTLNIDDFYQVIWEKKGIYGQDWAHLDTSISQVYRYAPQDKKSISWRYLGNNGQVLFPLTFYYNDHLGWRSGYETLTQAYFTSADSLRMIKTITPFTDFRYSLGSFKEQLLDATHAQSFFKQKLTVSAQIRRLNAPGNYKRQEGIQSHFNTQLRYNSAKGNYQILLANVENTAKMQQNGGLTYQNIFSDTTFLRKDVLGVNLADAVRYHKLKNILLYQALQTKIDTISLDSLATDSLQKILQVPPFFWKIWSRHQYNDYRYAYTDNNATENFYPAYILSSTYTHNELAVFGYENEVGFLLEKKGENLPYYVGLEAKGTHQYNILRYTANITQSEAFLARRYRQSTIFSGKFRFALPFLQFHNEAQYALGGFNQGDYQSLHRLALHYQDWGVWGNIGFSRLQAAEIFRTALGNHYVWEQNYLPTYHQYFGLGIFQEDNFRLSYTFHQVKNYLFFNAYQQTAQVPTTLKVHVFKIDLQQQWQHWHSSQQAYYQVVNYNEILPLPKWLAEAKLWYENAFFSDNLRIEAGVEVSYNDDYFAANYAPALGSFYVQNEAALAFYPVAGVFVNGKVSLLRFFVRMQHANQSIFNKQTGYYAALGYPMPDRNFQTGFIWYFYD
ncbi:MAG: putative porin [Chitinophagales bacterium]|nr:hypothetical protein [Bacteroidota bacterium]